MSHQALAESTQGRAKSQAICLAARTLFSCYGYRRVSLDDIAQEVGMSRSGIYNYFRNKEDILKTVVEDISLVSHQRAEAAASSDAPLIKRLQRIFDAKMVRPFAELHGTTHGEALTDQSMRVTDQLTKTWAMNFMLLVENVLAEANKAKEIDLAGVDLTPKQAALNLVLCARGLKTSGSEALTPQEYKRRVNKMIEVNILGLGGTN